MASITVMLGVLILVENDFQMFFWTFVSLFILTKSSIKFFRIRVPNLPETSLILQHCLQTLCLVGTLAYKPSSVRADVSDFDLSVQSTCCHFSHPTSFFCAFLCHEFFCTEKGRKRKGSLGASLSLKPLLTTLVQVVDGCVSLSSFLFKASQSCLFLCASVEKL